MQTFSERRLITLKELLKRVGHQLLGRRLGLTQDFRVFDEVESRGGDIVAVKLAAQGLESGLADFDSPNILNACHLFPAIPGEECALDWVVGVEIVVPIRNATRRINRVSLPHALIPPGLESIQMSVPLAVLADLTLRPPVANLPLALQSQLQTPILQCCEENGAIRVGKERGFVPLPRFKPPSPTG